MTSQKTILVVDDMKTVRVRLRMLLEEIGKFQIYETADGAQALECLKNVKCDLVISDWNMPKMNGIELIERIRGDSQLASMPVIFVTSENDKSAILQSLLKGVSDYVVKPFSDSIMKQKICAVLKIKQNAS